MLPHVEDILFANADPSNQLDSILLKTYKLHKLNTTNGRNKASYLMRDFIWSNRIGNSGKGIWGDCREMFESFFEKVSTNCRSSCEIGELFRFRICFQNPNHSEIVSHNIPFLSYTHSLEQVVTKLKQYQCKKCTDSIDYNSALLPGMITACNMIETNKLPPFLFVTDITNLVRQCKKTAQFPYKVNFAEVTYVLHAKVDSTAESGVHFYSVAEINYNHTSFLAKLDNFRDLQILTTDST